jgi:hypothetical protein
MMAVTVAAAFLPGIGAAPATPGAACVYGECPANNNGIPLGTLYLILALLAIVALVLGLLIYRERRGGGRQPPQEWAEGTEGAAAGGPAAANLYTEGPEDVSVPPPEVSGAVAAAGAGAAVGAAAGQEGDIDSLMAELDRISGEILKKGSGKKGGPGSSTGGSDSTGEDR